ncbi:MAG: hypothetical protein ACM3WU_00190 [Bacillota bacterium]
MSQRERGAFGRPREADLEKNLRPHYREYEEWRLSQMGDAAADEVVKKEAPKKFRLGKADLVFIVLGVIAAWIFQSCKTPQ